MNKYRKLIYGINVPVQIASGNKVIYTNFDNSATTPPFITVVEEVMKFLPYYSSIHRGMGFKSQFSTRAYEEGRSAVAEFLELDINKNSIVFVKNATEAINKLSNMLYDKFKNAIILTTQMEHHSNDLSWRKFNVKYVDVDNNGKLIEKDLEEKLEKYKGKVKLVAITGASNVTGYTNDIHKVAKLSHKYGAEILVDGAQLVPHVKVIMNDNENGNIDYLVFSAHKMYAPFGMGVLVGPKKELNSMEPDYKGGGTVEVVTYNDVKWQKTPEKDESGSPNVVGVVALKAAIDTLKFIGMDRIDKYEKQIFKYGYSKLNSISQVNLYSKYSSNSVGIIPFNIIGIYHETLAKILSYEFGIAVRSGCFCAQPYVQKLLNISDEESEKILQSGIRRPGMVRLSLGLYNTFEEIDYFVNALKVIISNKNKYLRMYD